MKKEEMVCPWWIAWTFDNPLRRFLHDPVKILGAYVKAGMTAVDIGCGMGYFSVGMARLVGKDGKVLSVDIQQQMLDFCARRAARSGVSDRVRTILTTPDSIGIKDQVDFVLAFWMVHEVKDIPGFFRQIAAALTPGGKMLYAEPRMHVSEKRFQEIVGIARGAGFTVENGPKVGISRAVVLVRSNA